MKTKMLTLAFLLTVLLCFLSACGNNGVSESQLIEDINNCEEIQDIFTSKYVSESQYTVTQCVVIKEQLRLDEKEDLIYCSVSIENDYFAVELDVKTVYSYYDKGGWMLEESSFNKTNVVAKKAPDADKVDSLIRYYASDPQDLQTLRFSMADSLEGGGLTGGELRIVDCVLCDGSVRATINCVYESACVKAEGSYALILDDEKGWIVPEEKMTIYGGNKKTAPILLTKYEADFSSAVGDFVWELESLFVGYSIHEISDDGVRYTLTTNWLNGVEGEKQGENIKVQFDLLYGRFNISESGKMYLTYNPQNDTWSNGSNRICKRIS